MDIVYPLGGIFSDYFKAESICSLGVVVGSVNPIVEATVYISCHIILHYF